MVSEMKRLLAPSSIATVPLYDLTRTNTQAVTDEWVIGDVPGVVDRFMGMRHTIPELARLTPDEAEHRLFLGTRHKRARDENSSNAKRMPSVESSTESLAADADIWMDECLFDASCPSAIQLLTARNQPTNTGKTIEWEE